MNAFGFLLPNRHSSATVCMSRNIHLHVPHEWGIDWIHSQKNVPKWSIHRKSVSGECKNKVRSMLLIANAVGFCYTCRLRLPLNADENVKPLNTDERVAWSKFSITKKYPCLLTRETDLIKSHILHELPWSVCQQRLSVYKESLGIGTYSTLWNTVHSPCICRYLLTMTTFTEISLSRWWLTCPASAQCISLLGHFWWMTNEPCLVVSLLLCRAIVLEKLFKGLSQTLAPSSSHPQSLTLPPTAESPDGLLFARLIMRGVPRALQSLLCAGNLLALRTWRGSREGPLCWLVPAISGDSVLALRQAFNLLRFSFR